MKTTRMTKRDVLPTTLTDEKIINFVKHRLHEENIIVKDIVICGYLLKENGYVLDTGRCLPKFLPLELKEFEQSATSIPFIFSL